MDKGEFSRVEIEEGVATVIIDRPDRMNALHPAAHYEISRLFDQLSTTPNLRVILVTGVGQRAFCAGYDLRDNVETGVMDLPPTGFAGFNARVHYPLPVIAVVNGAALGGGFELALACDFIIASENATFALPEPKVGWAAMGGGLQRLPRAVGMKRAMDIILTGRTVSADEALAIGLVSEVAEPANLLTVARRWADMIVACAPIAIRGSRQIAYGSFDLPTLNDALDISNYSLADEILRSEDAAEGKRAFVERRSPRWQDK